MLPLQKIKKTEMEIRTQRTVIITKKNREGKPSRTNPDSSAGIYVIASVEPEFRMIYQNHNIQEEENKISPKVNAF